VVAAADVSDNDHALHPGVELVVRLVVVLVATTRVHGRQARGETRID